jgi:hypothetical protein
MKRQQAELCIVVLIGTFLNPLIVLHHGETAQYASEWHFLFQYHSLLLGTRDHLVD